MSIKESLIKNYKKAGGSDPSVMESTSRLIENTGSSGGGDAGGYTVTRETLECLSETSVSVPFAGNATAFTAMDEAYNPEDAFQDAPGGGPLRITFDGNQCDAERHYDPSFGSNTAAYEYFFPEYGPEAQFIAVTRLNDGGSYTYAWKILLNDTNTHTISVDFVNTIVEVTPDFVLAVQEAMNQIG